MTADFGHFDQKIKWPKFNVYQVEFDMCQYWLWSFKFGDTYKIAKCFKYFFLISFKMKWWPTYKTWANFYFINYVYRNFYYNFVHEGRRSKWKLYFNTTTFTWNQVFPWYLLIIFFSYLHVIYICIWTTYF